MLEEMMHYTALADGKILEVIKRYPNASAKSILLFSHILCAQHIWANRIIGLQPKYSVWEENKVEQFENISNENLKLYAQILKEVPLNKEITYKISTGEIMNGIVQDILFHVINHSTYHRAQIASLFKLEGITPPITDYIILKRNHQL